MFSEEKGNQIFLLCVLPKTPSSIQKKSWCIYSNGELGLLQYLRRRAINFLFLFKVWEISSWLIMLKYS
jgi:hypothetical protein